MDLGNQGAKDHKKANLKAKFRRKCQKRVDVAQKMAPGCPNLRPESGQNDGDMAVIWATRGPMTSTGGRRQAEEKTTKHKDS